MQRWPPSFKAGDALLVGSDPFFASQREKLVDLVALHKLPSRMERFGAKQAAILTIVGRMRSRRETTDATVAMLLPTASCSLRHTVFARLEPAQPFRVSRHMLPISMNYFTARSTSH
jgi:hypothetical protein